MARTRAIHRRHTTGQIPTPTPTHTPQIPITDTPQATAHPPTAHLPTAHLPTAHLPTEHRPPQTSRGTISCFPSRGPAGSDLFMRSKVKQIATTDHSFGRRCKNCGGNRIRERRTLLRNYSVRKKIYTCLDCGCKVTWQRSSARGS